MNSLDHLADLIRTQLPATRLHTDPRPPDSFETGGIILAPATAQRISIAGTRFAIAVTIRVAVVAGTIRPDKVEPDLDARLFELAAILEPDRRFVWDTAERTMLDGLGHAWTLDVTEIFQIDTPKE